MPEGRVRGRRSHRRALCDPEEPENWIGGGGNTPNWWWGNTRPYREVRAIDPAGNKDPFLEAGRNAHKWYYIPPPPVGLILGITFGTIFLGVLIYLEAAPGRRNCGTICN